MDEVGFSGVLRLTDLNNYLGPSKECIKPINLSPVTKSVKIHVKEGTYLEEDEDGTLKSLQQTKISLSDCLACSGCITSAESILIETQSVSEFVSRIESRIGSPERQNPSNNNAIVAVSISPQSIVSLSTDLGTSMVNIYLLLNTLFMEVLHCDYLFDTGLARDISLLESTREFVNRYRGCDGSSVFPIISSSCPGWICYAEKSHGEYILPHLSSVKSPQQIMGVLVKNRLLNLINKHRNQKLAPSDIFHVALMPCYDKKLEASRSEFYDEATNSHDVDLVLTTLEIPQLLRRFNYNSLSELKPSNPSDFLYKSLTPKARESFGGEDQVDYTLYGVFGSSDSFAEHIFRQAAKVLFDMKVDSVDFKPLRNRDFLEATLVRDGKKVLSFAIAYGFRNIQTIVNQIKNNRCNYHYVEVMACPEGCLNGGGQLKIPNVILQKNILERIKQKFREEQTCKDPVDNRDAQEIHEEITCDEKILHTTYKSIKLQPKNPLLVEW